MSRPSVRHRVGGRVALASVVGVLLGACGSGGAPSAEERRGAPPVEPASGTPAGTYTLHEWGFIAAADDGSVRAVAGPHGLVAGSLPGLGLGHHGIGAGGKPVLYFHLDEGVAELELSVGIRPAGEAQLLEHFPPGELSHEQRALRWPHVRVTRGACRGSYPALTDERCVTSDGLCELAELAGYESAGADCVSVGEQRAGVLFYRSGPARVSLPLTVTRAGQAALVAQPSAPAAPVSGWVMRIARGLDRTLTRVRIVPLVGAQPVEVAPAVGDGSAGADEGIARLRAAVLEGGLDEPEANAFMTAWTDALFGAEPQPPSPSPTPPPTTIGLGAIGGPRHPLGSVPDALLYVLPQASVDALLPLELSPAPHTVRRVFLARVALSIDGQRVRLDPPTAEGALSFDVVRRILRRHMNALRHCIAADVVAGQVTVNLQVLPAGTVQRVTFEGQDIGRESRACLLTVGQRLTFPAAEAPTSVAQPIQISP